MIGHTRKKKEQSEKRKRSKTQRLITVLLIHVSICPHNMKEEIYLFFSSSVNRSSLITYSVHIHRLQQPKSEELVPNIPGRLVMNQNQFTIRCNEPQNIGQASTTRIDPHQLRHQGTVSPNLDIKS